MDHDYLVIGGGVDVGDGQNSISVEQNKITPSQHVENLSLSLSLSLFIYIGSVSDILSYSFKGYIERETFFDTEQISQRPLHYLQRSAWDLGISCATEDGSVPTSASVPPGYMNEL